MISNSTFPKRNDGSSDIYPNAPTQTFLVLFFIAFFLLCGADRVFTCQVHGFNFRWGQFLLLGLSLAALTRLARESRSPSTAWTFHLHLFFYWLPFFLLYAWAAALSATPRLTFLKWGWGVFNIGGAALVCLNPHWSPSLKRGFQLAILILACLIGIEAVNIYWFSDKPAVDLVQGSCPLYFHWFRMPVLVGFSQAIATAYEDWGGCRPNAFYYEPSYAGCALAFAFPLIMAVYHRRSGVKSILPAATVLTAVLLVGSRTGILSVFLSLSIVFVYALVQKQKNTLLFVLKTVGMALLFILVFAIPSKSRIYLQYLIGPMGTESIHRINNVHVSEGERLDNMKTCLLIWHKHLYWGNGVLPMTNGGSKGLAQVAMNTWLEIGIESGLLGVMAFLFALLATMREALVPGKNPGRVVFILAAWISHFFVDLNFSQTFPRLDYWLIFFFSILLLVQSPGEPAVGGKGLKGR